tara:strand:- start:1070 stop:2233 length:1164 start_codon:yes stop_codon:yes gene_type:complete
MQQLHSKWFSFWKKSRKSMVIKEANKCYIYDSHDNEFIDTSMGSGAQIIGHNNNLIKKIINQVHKGTIYTIPNCYTEEVNNYLHKYFNPDLDEKYVFCNSGTEANMRAIRLARAYTNKEKIAKFHGGWHGGLDGFIEGCGVPEATKNLITTLPYNDDKCLKKITNELAAVIIEPVQGSNPRSDIGPFLHKVQDKCKENNVLLILDEVMTGFRLSALGGRGIFNINPDIVTYGKVLGGGLPIGALGAKPHIMETANVFYGGTFSANPLTMAASKSILKTIINSKHIKYSKLKTRSQLLRDELNDLFLNKKKSMRIIGCGPINRIIFTDKPIKNREDRDKFENVSLQKAFYERLKQNGVFINTNGIIHLSMCHTRKIIYKIINAIQKSL